MENYRMAGTIGASKPETGNEGLTLEQIATMETSALDSLTERELEILGLIANGDSSTAIGERLGIKPNTIGRHTNNIYLKLPFDEGVNRRVKAVLMYREKYPFEFVRQQVEVNLTPRQYETLSLMAHGYSNSGIAEKLGIKPKTVDHHINGIYLKLPLPFDKSVDIRVMAALIYMRTPDFLSSRPTPLQPS